MSPIMELLSIVPEEQTYQVTNYFEKNVLPPESTAGFLVAGLIQKNFLGISETKPRRVCGIM